MQLSKTSNYIYSTSAIRLIETGTYERAVNITQNIGNCSRIYLKEKTN